MLTNMWKKIRAWWTKPAPADKIVVRIIQRDPFRVRMADWRSNKDLVKMAHEVLRDQRVRQMLDCLRNEHIAFYSLPLNVEPGQCAALFRQSEGYQAALNNFEALGTILEETPQLEATFSPEESLPTSDKHA